MTANLSLKELILEAHQILYPDKQLSWADEALFDHLEMINQSPDPSAAIDKITKGLATPPRYNQGRAAWE